MSPIKQRTDQLRFEFLGSGSGTSHNRAYFRHFTFQVEGFLSLFFRNEHHPESGGGGHPVLFVADGDDVFRALRQTHNTEILVRSLHIRRDDIAWHDLMGVGEADFEECLVLCLCLEVAACNHTYVVHRGTLASGQTNEPADHAGVGAPAREQGILHVDSSLHETNPR